MRGAARLKRPEESVMETGFGSGVNWHKLVALGAVVSLFAGGVAGCTAFNPQGAAQQYAPSYYNTSYSSLSAEQKMQLENHLANQSNQAWRTTSQMASGLGWLAQGTGVLLFAVRH
jgi:hypothetical protein